MIIDAHCHVASTHFTPRSFAEGVVDSMLCAMHARGVPASKRALMDMYLSTMQDHQCDELVAQMSDAGIERTVLLLPDFTYALRDSELTIAEMFDRHAEILARHPTRLHVFAGVDPRWGRDGIELFERGLVSLGFSGLKIYPPCGYSPSARELYPYYELCAAHGCPVLTHTGATSPALSFEHTNPLCIDQAARDFPNVAFILAHASGWNMDEHHMMAASRPNIYLDISGYGAFPAQRVSGLVGRDIDHKIIFGTDWPVFRMQATQQELVTRLMEEQGPLGRIPARERALITAKNISRLLPRKAETPDQATPARSAT